MTSIRHSCGGDKVLAETPLEGTSTAHIFRALAATDVATIEVAAITMCNIHFQLLDWDSIERIGVKHNL